MSEIERAIAHIERMQAHGMEAVDGGMFEQKMLDNIAESIVMMEIALTALREKAERERGCAYCVIGKRSPDAEYCSNCGRKLTPTLPELANESEEVNPDSHQYVDNYSTNRRKSVKQKCRNLHSETAETCTLRCDYCGKYTRESDLTTVWTEDKYLMCRKCRGNDWPCLCANGEEQVVESASSPPYRANYCGLCGRFIGGDHA